MARKDRYCTPLTDVERSREAVLLAGILRKRVGEPMAMSNAEIRKVMAERGFMLADSKVRQLINYIRRTGLVERLIANSKGYYVAVSYREVDDYCDSLLNREAEIREVRQALQTQRGGRIF